jgi:hypothetical protein
VQKDAHLLCCVEVQVELHLGLEVRERGPQVGVGAQGGGDEGQRVARAVVEPELCVGRVQGRGGWGGGSVETRVGRGGRG